MIHIHAPSRFPRNAILASALYLGGVLLAPFASAQIMSTTGRYPPDGGTFSSEFFVQPIFTFSRVNPNDTQIKDSRILVTAGEALPPFVGTSIVPFIFTYSGSISFNSGANFSPFLTTGLNGTLAITFVNQVGPTRFFDTEMLQLDITGGTFPGGCVMRESPTRASLGPTTITDMGAGVFRIDSFFDIFTELSLDNGQSWHPGNQSGRHQLMPEPASLAALGLGALCLIRRSRRRAP